MNWTIDWEYDTHPLDEDRPISVRENSRSRVVTWGVDEDDLAGEVIWFDWYRTDYVWGYEDDLSKQHTVVDDRVSFLERWPSDSPIKLRFDIEGEFIQRIRVYRGRRKTHDFNQNHLLFNRLSFIGREAWYGCLRGVASYDCRGMSPTVKLPWETFKLVATGKFVNAYYRGDVKPLIEQVI